MMDLTLKRRKLIHALALLPVGTMLRSSSVSAQSDIVQPSQKTKAGFLAHARALRDQAVREGDQAYGAVVVRAGFIVGEGRNYVVAKQTQRRTPSCWPCAMHAVGSRRVICPTATSLPPPRLAPCARRPFTGPRVRRYHNESTPEEGLAPRLPARPESQALAVGTNRRAS